MLLQQWQWRWTVDEACEYEEQHACDDDWRDMDSIDEGMLGFECSDDDDDD